MDWLKSVGRLFGWQRREKPLSHLQVRLYTRAGCHLCEDAWRFLQAEQTHYHFQLETVDIDKDLELIASYGNCVPVVMIDGKVRFRGGVNVVLWRRLVRAQQR